MINKAGVLAANSLPLSRLCPTSGLSGDRSKLLEGNRSHIIGLIEKQHLGITACHEEGPSESHAE